MEKIIKTDLFKIPHFRVALEFSYFSDLLDIYLQYLNVGAKVDPNVLTVKLIAQSMRYCTDKGTMTLRSLYFDLAEAVLGVYDGNGDDDEIDFGYQLIRKRAKEFVPIYNDEFNHYDFSIMNVGEHLYYAFGLLSRLDSDDDKAALCYSLYELMKCSIQSELLPSNKEIEDFERFLKIRLMNFSIKISFNENQPLISGLKNIRGKFEFYEISEIMEACTALDKRLINDDEYSNDYCYGDEDEFDAPFYVYEDNFFDEEYDNFKVFEGESNLVQIALLKDEKWSVYELISFEYPVVERIEVEQLRGKEIIAIKKIIHKDISLIPEKWIGFLDNSFYEKSHKQDFLDQVFFDKHKQILKGKYEVDDSIVKVNKLKMLNNTKTYEYVTELELVNVRLATVINVYSSTEKEILDILIDQTKRGLHTCLHNILPNDNQIRFSIPFIILRKSLYGCSNLMLSLDKILETKSARHLLLDKVNGVVFSPNVAICSDINLNVFLPNPFFIDVFSVYNLFKPTFHSFGLTPTYIEQYKIRIKNVLRLVYSNGYDAVVLQSFVNGDESLNNQMKALFLEVLSEPEFEGRFKEIGILI